MRKVQSIPCWLDKKINRGDKHYSTKEGHRVGGINNKIASTITSRYHFGAYADRDNMVLEVWTK